MPVGKPENKPPPVLKQQLPTLEPASKQPRLFPTGQQPPPEIPAGPPVALSPAGPPEVHHPPHPSNPPPLRVPTRLTNPAISPRDINWNFPLHQQLTPCLEEVPSGNCSTVDLKRRKERPFIVTEGRFCHKVKEYFEFQMRPRGPPKPSTFAQQQCTLD